MIRLVWSEERTVSYAGRFYSLSGLHPGPPPARDRDLARGAQAADARLTGRAADGWSVSLGYAGLDELPAMQRRIDEAADAAGRPPAAIRRLLNVPAEVTADDLARMVELGFDTFDAWPREDEEAAIRRFGEEIAPRVRELVGDRRPLWHTRACYPVDAALPERDLSRKRALIRHATVPRPARIIRRN